jgi:ABC-type Fe3+ transport system permease subunit
MLAMISFRGETRYIGKGNRMSDRTLWIIYVISSLMAGIGFVVLLGCLLIAAS